MFEVRTPQDITAEKYVLACRYMKTQEFRVRFYQVCSRESLPAMPLAYMKTLKTDFIDVLMNREQISESGDSARLLAAWIDAVLEFTVLKHEAMYLTVKKTTVLAKIKEIQKTWPKKKHFLESAYKILLFTKRVKLEINLVMKVLKEENRYEFMDYSRAKEVVLTSKVLEGV